MVTSQAVTGRTEGRAVEPLAVRLVRAGMWHSVLLALLLPGYAQAHRGADHEALLAWQFDPWVVFLLFASSLTYAAGAWRLRRAGRGGVLGPWRIGAFAGGTLILAAALLSPLDALADHYFSAHMSQHLLLMLAAPPLLVASNPAIAWMWCLPRRRRRAISRWWASGRSLARHTIAALLHPMPVWLGASLALWFWHTPRPYAWALADQTVHAFEHASFFLTSLAFWYLLFAPRGRARLGYGGAILFGVTFGMQNGFLGAILTFATHPFYAAHVLQSGSQALALEDQQLAGIIMWVPASIVHLVLLGALFAQWLREEERRALALPRGRLRPT